jgi:tetratricopeptide (TPR) repeat protein
MLNIALDEARATPEARRPAETTAPGAKSLPANAADLSRKYFQKGESYRSRGDLRRALGCYTEAIRLDPQLVQALVERGQIYRQGRKPDRAIADFNAALELDSTLVDVYQRRGNALLDQGRIEEAITDFNTAIQIDPTDAEAYLHRARAHFRNKDNSNVIEDATQALRLDSELANAYLLRGTAYSSRNHHDEALADFDKAVQCEPRNALAYNERGLAYARKGDYTQAIANYSKAIGVAPKFALARFNRGLANRLAGNYKLAIAEFSAFLTQQPNTLEAYLQRGLAYRGQRDFAFAIADFNQVLSLKPDHAEAMQFRAATEQEAIQEGELVNMSPAEDADIPFAEEQPLAAPVMKPSATPISTGSPAESAPPTPAVSPPSAGPTPVAAVAAQRALAQTQLRKRGLTAKAIPPAVPPARSAATDGRRAFRIPVPEQWRRIALFAAAVTGGILLIGAGMALVGSIGVASAGSEDTRFTTEQLSDQGNVDRAKGKEIEVSGVAESISKGDDSAPAVTLIGKGGGKIVCTIDPLAPSTKTMFPNIEKGKFVVVKGRCNNDDGAVKLVDARVAFVMNPAKKLRTKAKR